MFNKWINSITINQNDYGSSDSLANLCIYIIGHKKNQAALNRLCWFIGDSVTSIEIIFHTGYFIGYYDKVRMHLQSNQKRTKQNLPLRLHKPIR
jgi:hypothetical protein